MSRRIDQKYLKKQRKIYDALRLHRLLQVTRTGRHDQAIRERSAINRSIRRNRSNK